MMGGKIEQHFCLVYFFSLAVEVAQGSTKKGWDMEMVIPRPYISIMRGSLGLANGMQRQGGVVLVDSIVLAPVGDCGDARGYVMGYL